MQKYIEKNLTDYNILIKQLKGFIDISNHYIPVLSNAGAIIMSNMENLNWAGFYLTEEFLQISDKTDLILGPYCGSIACVKIAVGKGVCGNAVKNDKIMIVPDVHQFPGHIACDSASNSEIVIPIHKDNKIIGVLDIDSPMLDRFSSKDSIGLTDFVHTLEALVFN